MIFTDAHQFLIDLDYEYIYFAESYEDDGDGERGLNAIYYPAYGAYVSDVDVIVVDASGRVNIVVWTTPEELRALNTNMENTNV